MLLNKNTKKHSIKSQIMIQLTLLEVFIMISTSSYKNWQSDKFLTYSISGDRGKNIGYKGEVFNLLAPKLSFWKVWHENIGNISLEENNKYYIEEYYKQVLKDLDPEEIYKQLDNSVLLCYEENNKFCHRHIVAAWLEILLGIKVYEKKAIDWDIEVVERPSYIKKYLADIMVKNLDMRGFNSLRALYLFTKSEKYEQEALRIKEIFGNHVCYIDDFTGRKVKAYDGYVKEACVLRCVALDVEQQYNEKQQIKKKLIRKHQK